MRRNLVIVRAGNSSLHEQWLLGAAERNWDLIVSYFGDDTDRFRAPDVRRIDSKGPKWPALAALLRDLAPQLDAYDYVWLPDDDLAADAATINQMFAVCARYNLTLAQPALSENSYLAHDITRVDRRRLLRYTNFVEIMAPCFRRDFLLRCLPEFDTNLSGWGLDYVWPTMVEGRSELAIIDATVVRHTRPLGGPNYRTILAAGVSPKAELWQLLRDKHIPLPQPAEYGHIDPVGVNRQPVRPRESIAVCTTVRTPRPDFGVWLDYHLRKADLVIVFLRDPTCRSSVEPLTTGKSVLLLDGSTPMANHGWALVHALRHNITWLLPLDDNEIFFDGGDHGWQAGPGVGQVSFVNHEALPVDGDVVNRYALCTLFNVNGKREFLGHGGPKNAVRVTPGVRPTGPHTFAGCAGREHRVAGPVILQYPYPSFDSWAAEFADRDLRGRVPDAETSARLLVTGELLRFEPMAELMNRAEPPDPNRTQLAAAR